MITQAYVINLKTRPDRWKQINKDFKETGLELKRWDAVLGKNLSDDKIRELTSNYCYRFCSYGMIGCWLSHVSLWKHIVEKNLDNVLVLEDDAVPVKDFNEKFKKIEGYIPQDYDILYLGCVGSCTKLGSKVAKLINNPNKPINKYIIEPSYPYALHAYIITNKGAKKILSKVEKVSNHLDIYLTNYIYSDKSVKKYALKENLIDQLAESENSDIVTNHHPILINLGSKIKMGNNMNMGYIFSVDFLNIRHLNFNITYLTLLLFVLFFSIGRYTNYGREVSLAYLGLVLIEALIRKKSNFEYFLFEMLISLYFLLYI